MRKKNRMLISALLVCLVLSVLPGMSSRAEETEEGTSAAVSVNQDENSQRLEEVTGMDENANIFELEDSGGIVDESAGEEISPYLRIAQGPQVVNFKTRDVSVNTEYIDTATEDAGYTNGSYGADAAYLGMSGGKVKFMLSGVVGLVDAGAVQVTNLSDVSSVSYYAVSKGKLVHYISQNLNEETTSAITNGTAPDYLQPGVTYYSYDGHYFYTDYAVMLSDYRNEVRLNSVNPENPFYNYYQYLPLRSRSIYSADSLNTIIGNKTGSRSVLRNTGVFFVQYQDTYGVNALLALSIAANESGWGMSSISQNKNNLFGLNAVDSSPGQSANYYASTEQCISEFMGNYMSAKYLNPQKWQYYGGFLGNKASGINVKYASDPYWGEKAAAIAWTLDGLGGSADGERYTIGIKEDSSNVNVRREASASSTVLYTTGKQLTHAVLILNSEQENGFYRIQSDAVLDAGRSGVSSAWEYEFDSMYAYISSRYVSVANSGTVEEPKPAALTSITIVQAPVKTVYTEGEMPDMTGMQVNAQYDDGSEKDVTAEVTYPSGALAAGTEVITVSYTENGVTVSAEQAVTVNEAEDPEENPEEDSLTGDVPEVGGPLENEPSGDEPAEDSPSEDQISGNTTGDDLIPESSPADNSVTDDFDTQSLKTDSETVSDTDDSGVHSVKTGTGTEKQTSAAAQAERATAPKTGDSGDASLWAALIAVSGIVLAVSAVRRRQR